MRYRLPSAALPGLWLGQQRSIELRLSASDFLDRIAALIAPLRKLQLCYFGVLAPDLLWLALLTAYAGRKLAASKAIRPKAMCEVTGDMRAG